MILQVAVAPAISRLSLHRPPDHLFSEVNRILYASLCTLFLFSLHFCIQLGKIVGVSHYVVVDANVVGTLLLLPVIFAIDAM